MVVVANNIKFFGQKNFFSLFKKISLVKFVQNEKFLYKKCCQKFCLSKNDKSNTSGQWTQDIAKKHK